MSDNLIIYNQVRTVPDNALKRIDAGRLKGKSDINPMWRLKTLTELFGLCGVGWKYVITKQWLEQSSNGEIGAFVNIDLYVKVDGEWSEPIPGTGGSMFVANESKGPYTSDECFKMALTDAISVSCKALGFGADVYWQADSTKYSKPPERREPMTQGQALKPLEESYFLEDHAPPKKTKTEDIGTEVCSSCLGPITPAEIKYSTDKFGRPLCRKCQAEVKRQSAK